MKGEFPFVSVVVPVRDGAATVAECVQSILATEWPRERREVIVVDNGSRDGTPARLGGLPVRLLREERIGRSHARNRGVLEARGEIVVFTDADCVVDPGWIAELVSGFDADDVWGVGGEIHFTNRDRVAERFIAAHDRDHQRFVLSLDPPFAITSNVAYRRRTFETIGLFDPAFTTAEDVDLGWRFHRAGLRYSYRPKAIVRHRPRATVGALLRQQEAFGFGRAMLRDRYGLERGFALGTTAGLRRAATRLLRALVGQGQAGEADALALEVAVRLALRAGAARYDLCCAMRAAEQPLTVAADALDESARALQRVVLRMWRFL